jgi:hypothetical protein
LNHFHHQRHDVVVFQLLDSAELDFPFQQPIRFRGLEQGPQVVTDPAPLRHAYQQELQKFLRTIRGACQEGEIEYHLIRTGQPFDGVLSAFLSSRTAKGK